ncbi:four-helix bundle copper-binding protein [Sphaerotilus mobilis]|uniref:Cys-rich four helix bundle protein (Predicted Tat secretion target) n=1 Tax=Sphaerotilus mobilis TaxID=47994 RepID=A0A4Q7LR49_9BURK|nr:four-helix bundle copper-binding protein [Sphaerotilus mobilis]RZS56891.1 Cys-rich four helix bundle protein (predicted Tat secretion target) [Sphaerotilus mobilis]
MDRRTLIQTAGTTALAAFATAAAAQAADPHAHHHGGHAGHGAPNAALIAAASACVSTGQACLAHCLVLLGNGDKEMAGCAQSVNQLLAVCDALHKVAAQQGPILKDLARVAAKTCEACEKECRKHASKHAECKACADSCVDCAKQCKAIAA